MLKVELRQKCCLKNTPVLSKNKMASTTNYKVFLHVNHVNENICTQPNKYLYIIR